MIHTFQAHAMRNDSTLKMSVRNQFFRSQRHDSRNSTLVGTRPPGAAAAAELNAVPRRSFERQAVGFGAVIVEAPGGVDHAEAHRFEPPG